MSNDADTVLADDPEGFARLQAILHGPAGMPVDRRLPTLAERFGVAAETDSVAGSRASAAHVRRRWARKRVTHGC